MWKLWYHLVTRCVENTCLSLQTYVINTIIQSKKNLRDRFFYGAEILHEVCALLYAHAQITNNVIAAPIVLEKMRMLFSPWLSLTCCHSTRFLLFVRPAPWPTNKTSFLDSISPTRASISQCEKCIFLALRSDIAICARTLHYVGVIKDIYMFININ